MSNPKLTAVIKQEPGTQSTKKQVKIKVEPTLISSNSGGNAPITPVTKTVRAPAHRQHKPHQKVLDAAVDGGTSTGTAADKNNMSSKFYIKSVDFEDELDGSKSMISVPINSETPTRKRSKSQEQKEKLLKKAKSIDISSTNPPTPLSIKPVKPPIKFKPINGSLMDSSIEEIDLLKDVFNSNFEISEELKVKYHEIAHLSSKDWILKGFQTVNKNYGLVKRIIMIRFELNAKFNKIFSIINRYGEHLEKNDDELNDKMQRLQTLGEEIKNFIK